MMSKKYQTRPSSILDIDDSYLAYMIDEFSLYLVSLVTDKDGKVNWNNIKVTDEKQKTTKNNNSSFKEHIKQLRE